MSQRLLLQDRLLYHGEEGRTIVFGARSFPKKSAIKPVMRHKKKDFSAG
jgi:hypothetical protein